jgi:hypothetical protein
MPVTFNVAPVDVVNEALGQLGKDFITDLDDTNDPVAVKAKQYFGSVLRTMLRDHIWNFAKTRIALGQNVTAPLSGWAYSYALPGDCFRVLTLNSSDKSIWEIEGRNLLTDESPAVIQYIRWVDDPNQWAGDFYQAFVTHLAVRFAPAFHSDMAKASDLYKLYQMQLADAKAVDGQESSQEQMSCDDLTDAIRE